MNKLLIQERLALINDYVTQLERLSQTPREAFLNNKDLAAAAESYLRRSLEAIFDIGRHIIAKKGGTELSTEYKSIARGLGEKNIISDNLRHKLIQMAGYRNRLVHLYHVINDEELFEILQQDLYDLKLFVAEINAFIEHE